MSFQMSQAMMDEVDAMSTEELCALLGIDQNASQTFTRMDIITIGVKNKGDTYISTEPIDTQEKWDNFCKPLYAAHTLCEEKHFNLPKEAKFQLSDW